MFFKRTAVAEVMEARLRHLVKKLKKLLQLDQKAGSETVTANQWKRFRDELKWFQETVSAMEARLDFLPDGFPWRQPLTDTEWVCKKAECIQMIAYYIGKMLECEEEFVKTLEGRFIRLWIRCCRNVEAGNWACETALQTYHFSEPADKAAALRALCNVVKQCEETLPDLMQLVREYREAVDGVYSDADSEKAGSDGASDDSFDFGEFNRGSGSDNDSEDKRWPSDFSDEEHLFSDDDSAPAARGRPHRADGSDDDSAPAARGRPHRAYGSDDDSAPAARGRPDGADNSDDDSAPAARGTYHSVTTGGRSWMRAAWMTTSAAVDPETLMPVAQRRNSLLQQQ
eukprot:308825-Rhodomonas_salina.1